MACAIRYSFAVSIINTFRTLSHVRRRTRNRLRVWKANLNLNAQHNRNVDIFLMYFDIANELYTNK